MACSGPARTATAAATALLRRGRCCCPRAPAAGSARRSSRLVRSPSLNPPSIPWVGWLRRCPGLACDHQQELRRFGHIAVAQIAAPRTVLVVIGLECGEAVMPHDVGVLLKPVEPRRIAAEDRRL